jgi:hypothetical protein
VALDFANAGINSAARMAMTAMTTSNSRSVNAGLDFLFLTRVRIAAMQLQYAIFGGRLMIC